MSPASSSPGTRNQVTGTADKFTVTPTNDPTRHHNARKAFKTTQTGRGNASVVKKWGRRRGVRSLGRYPFVVYVKKYMESVQGYYAEPTLKELDRRLRRMAKDFDAMMEKGMISTTNPERVKPEDVARYISFLKARGVQESGIVHNLSTLKSLLLYANNPAVEKLKQKHPSLVPKRHIKRHDPISAEDQNKIIDRSKDITGWKRLKAYTLVVLCMSTGLRPKEVRLSNVGDLNLNEWSIRVIHVKGEGSYGQERKVPIDPKGRPLIKRYLALRAEMMAERSPPNQALFPALNDKDGDGYLSANSLIKMKCLVEEEIESKFELRACRRTFGQNLIDLGAKVEAVSVLLGHSTTKTTETYYARKKQDAAIEEANSIWERTPPKVDNSTNLIESKKYITGYA